MRPTPPTWATCSPPGADPHSFCSAGDRRCAPVERFAHFSVPLRPRRCLSRPRKAAPLPPEDAMKKTVIGFISLVALGLLLGFGNAKRQGADDPCGGCPKDFKCDLVSLQCVPEDAHR